METILQTSINDLVSIFVGTVVPALLIYGITLFKAWSQAKVAAIKDQQLRDALDFALNRLDQTAQTVTAEIRQRYVTRDQAGKVENADSLAVKGVNMIHSRIDPSSRATLERIYGREVLAKIYRGKLERYAKPVPKC